MVQMASVSLFCLAFTLSLSSSVTLATVDIFQSQDRSCPGMKASVTCITTTVNGYLQWIINNVPVFIVNSGETASFNQTINGSEFVFVRGVSAFGVNVYTSTVSLNTGQTTSICCSDGFLKQTLDIGFVGPPSAPQNFAGSSSQCTWEPPADTPNCCTDYVVISASDTMQIPVNGLATVFSIPDVTSDDTTIEVFCRDRLGRESAISSQIALTVPIVPSPTCPQPYPLCTDEYGIWWIWVIIGLLAVGFVIATPVAIVMTVLCICKNRAL